MSTTPRRPSTVGRPRRLTDTQIHEILTWHATRLTAKEVAARYGISTALLHQVIRQGTKGYKQPSPDQRHQTIAAAHRRREHLRHEGWL